MKENTQVFTAKVVLWAIIVLSLFFIIPLSFFVIFYICVAFVLGWICAEVFDFVKKIRRNK